MADHRTVIAPFRDVPGRICSWCGEALVYGRRDRRWHDGREDEPNCVHDYRMASDHDYVRSVARREGWYFCVDCGRQGPGLHGPYETIWANARSTSAALARSVEQLIPGVAWWDTPGSHVLIRELPARTPWHVTLQVDHVVPLIDGGSHGLENLALRCPDHHKLKTAREARERAARRRGVDGQLSLGVA